MHLLFGDIKYKTAGWQCCFCVWHVRRFRLLSSTTFYLFVMTLMCVMRFWQWSGPC